MDRLGALTEDGRALGSEPVFVNLLRSPGINSKPGGIDLSISIPEYVILEDFNFTQGRLYFMYNLPQLDLYLGYLLNLLKVPSGQIGSK